MTPRTFPLLPYLAPVLLAVGLGGCGDDGVKLYVALDQEHSEQLVSRFTEQTGIAVDPQFDTEQSKTVGLVNTIIEEADRPRCDVFWNNELAHTVRLGQKGLLAPYASPAAADIPAHFKSDEDLWTGFAARARVIIVNTEALGDDPADWPQSIQDFTDPKWKGRCAIARPLTGTTLTHFAALRFALGEEGFERWLDELDANDVVFLQSNSATMRQTAEVGNGIDFALTDTDDFHVALTKGHPVGCVFPDQGDDQLGTMLIPNSVAIVKDGPQPELAQQLVDYILSQDVEAMLAASKSAQIPVRAAVPGPESEWILGIGEFRQMTWDASQVAGYLADAHERFARRYGGGE